MNEPAIKVTVGICVRNSALTVKDAVVSVLNQNYPQENIELIIVDGYSRDGTLRIIQEILKETNIRNQVFYENEGLGAARQIVVDNANGEYIVWVDGDMVLKKNFLKTQVAFMENHPEVGIAKGKYGSPNSGENLNIVADLENIEFMLSTMLEGETESKALGTSGCIYRVHAIRKVGGFDFHIKGVGEDMDAENRIRKAGWQLHIVPALFYETRRQTWRSLWNEYFWHGKGNRYIFKKDRRLINLYRLLPPIAILVELLRVPSAYKLTHKKVVLLLPFHYVFKRVAWVLGFTKSIFAK